MSVYRMYSTGGVGSKERRRAADREVAEQEVKERQALVRRSAAITAIADLMAEQNEKMVRGLRAVQQQTSSLPSPKIDYVARNINAVGPSRPTIGRKEQALLARAEVMAAATTHLGEGTHPPAAVARPPWSYPPRIVADPSVDLVRAAREEMARGYEISAYENLTRRPPAKLVGMGRSWGGG